jgi:hypothetical protein
MIPPCNPAFRLFSQRNQALSSDSSHVGQDYQQSVFLFAVKITPSLLFKGGNIMRSHNIIGVFLFSSAVLLAAAPVVAQTVRLACGGESQNSFTQMMAAEKAHALLILYVSKDARYLSDVETQLVDATGKTLVEVKKCGPLGHLDVSSAGQYELKARHQGVEQQRSVQLTPKGGARVMFMWD